MLETSFDTERESGAKYSQQTFCMHMQGGEKYTGACIVLSSIAFISITCFICNELFYKSTLS